MTRPSETSRGLCLLLVEDNHGDVLLFRRTITRQGLGIVLDVVASGEAAMERLSGGDLPDLIVSDLNLPRMSGLEFLEAVKSKPGLRRIPVLVLSSSTREADIAAAYDRHASGYLAKPIDASAYSEILKSIEDYWSRLAQLPSEKLPGIRE